MVSRFKLSLFSIEKLNNSHITLNTLACSGMKLHHICVESFRSFFLLLIKNQFLYLDDYHIIKVAKIITKAKLGKWEAYF